jgi:hypothetical protein
MGSTFEHPLEWEFDGYNEIQAPRERYSLIDYERLRKLLGFSSMHDLAEVRPWSDPEPGTPNPPASSSPGPFDSIEPT